MYKVCNNGKEMKFASKEELIRYFMQREPINVCLRSDADLEKYMPSLFDHVALSPNDCYRPGLSGRAMHGEFYYTVPPELQSRTIIVYEDNRIIDIREWLPEFRAYLIQFKKGYSSSNYRFSFSGSKPTHTKTYRIIHGYRQSRMTLSQSDQDDILASLGYIPAKFHGCARRMEDNFRYKDRQRSWKKNSKARRSWQRHKKASTSLSIRTSGIEVDDWITPEEETNGILDALFSYCEEM